MTIRLHRNRPSVSRRPGSLAALLLLAVLGSVALAAAPPDGLVPGEPGAPGASEPAPPLPPVDAQHCFEKYQQNLSRCYDICCFDLLWLWHVDCDDACLIPCFSKAEATYEACMGHCPHCGGDLG
jgi:hypothetical protein